MTVGGQVVNYDDTDGEGAVPAARGTRSRWRRDGRDLLLALVAAALGVVFVVRGHEARAPEVLGAALAVGQALPLAALTRTPLVAFVASEAANLAYGALGYPPSPVSFAPYLILAVVASRRDRAALGCLGGALAVVVLIGTARPGPSFPAEYLANTGVVVLFFVGGREVASFRKAHEATAARMRLAAEMEAAILERDRLQERLELARELHDTLGNALAIMRLQAETARRAMRVDPARADDALEVADRRAAQALTQVQGLLARLGDPVAPQRRCGLVDLQVLVAEVRATGLHASWVEEGQTAELAPLASHVLYRVLQESLANVLRHAHASRVRVTVSWSDNEVALRVSDDGVGGEVHPGRGLAGMAARVEGLGGHLCLTNGDEGGFAVVASLPLVYAGGTR